MRGDRREFLVGVGGALVVGIAGCSKPAQSAPRKVFVSCGRYRDGEYCVAGFDGRGESQFEVALPERGHGIAHHPDRAECVVFARRPGTFAMVLNYMNGVDARWIKAARGRHFQGHGVFTADGRTLITSENDYDAGRGLLGIYDAGDGYKRIGEVPSQGIGPHELRLMPGGNHLVVANGGIRTHPDFGRAKLNIDTMEPNLLILRVENGALQAMVKLPTNLRKLSIRHLDVSREGRVAIALQYEGDRRDRVPLVGLWQRGDKVCFLRAPKAAEQRMRHYAGSVAFDADDTVLAVSSPRGHVITFWDTRKGIYLSHVEAKDACGVSSTGKYGEFLVTAGNGAIRLIDTQMWTARVVRTPDSGIGWDNHVSRVI